MRRFMAILGLAIIAFLAVQGVRASAQSSPGHTFGQNPKAYGVMAGVIKIGTGGAAVTPAWPLEVGGTWTAKSGIADAVSIYTTLKASANNDVLTAVSINPTFTPGAFSGVSQVGLAVLSGSVAAAGGLQASTSGSQPTCAVGTRGTIWVVQGGTGVTDTLEACLKSAANAYAWTTIVTGG